MTFKNKCKYFNEKHITVSVSFESYKDYGLPLQNFEAGCYEKKQS